MTTIQAQMRCTECKGPVTVEGLFGQCHQCGNEYQLDQEYLDAISRIAGNPNQFVKPGHSAGGDSVSGFVKILVAAMIGAAVLAVLLT